MRQALNMRRFAPAPDLVKIAMAPPGVYPTHDPAPLNLRIYTIPPSLCSQRVRMALAEKELPYTEKIVDTANGANLRPDYIALNPRALVPTLTFADRSLFDSATIMRFANNHFRGPALAPTDPARFARMNAWLARSDDFPIRGFTYRAHLASGRPDYWRKGMHDNILKAMNEYPQHRELYELKLRDWNDLAAWIATPQDAVRDEVLAQQMADDLERNLTSEPFVLGEQFTLADVTIVVLMVRLQCGCGVWLWGKGRRPHLEEYIARMQERPSYDSAILAPYRGTTAVKIDGDCWGKEAF